MSTKLFFLAAAAAAAGLALGARFSPHHAYVKRNAINQTVHVIFEKHVPSGRTTLSARNADQTEFYGVTCGGELDVGGSVVSVTLTDDLGHGWLEAGGANYTIDFDTDASGGISCSRRYNPVHCFVECFVPVESLPRPVSPEGLYKCFEGLEGDFVPTAAGFEVELPVQFQPALPQAPEDDDLAPDTNGTLEARQVCRDIAYTYPWNDGEPRMMAKHTQMSNSLRCAAPGCEIGRGVTQGITHTASVSVNLGQWISAGYSVSFSTEVSETSTRYGGADDDICIWNYWRHQRYRALTGYRTCSDYFSKSSGRFQILSPHSGRHCCVANSCRNKGDVWWEDYRDGVW